MQYCLNAQFAEHSEAEKHTALGSIKHSTSINNIYFNHDTFANHSPLNTSQVHDIIPTQYDDPHFHNLYQSGIRVHNIDEEQSEVERKALTTTTTTTNGSLMDNLQLHMLPGFRFHPTEYELVGFYLRRKIEGMLPPLRLIPHVDLYLHDPWELSTGMEKSLQREWFFFVSRNSKYPDGGRPNRQTKCGFWKATGIDKRVKANLCDKPNSSSVFDHCHGLRKTLVYYKGRAPKGVRTHWIMNEYRLSYNSNTNHAINKKLQSSITLCKVYKKSLPNGVIEGRKSESIIGKSPSNKVIRSDYKYKHKSIFGTRSLPHATFNHYQQESCINHKDETIKGGSLSHYLSSSELTHHFWERCVQMTTMSSFSPQDMSNEREEQKRLIST